MKKTDALPRRILLLEGGGMRGAFTCGVLNALKASGIKFDEVCAISSGAVAALFYLSGNSAFLRVLFPLIQQKKIFGLSSFWRGNGLFGLPILFSDDDFIRAFDEKQFFANETALRIGLTRIKDAQQVFRTKDEIKDKASLWQVVQASASLPVIAAPVILENEAYVDGGMVESIPLSLYDLSKQRIVVVHTQVKGYKKTKRRLDPLSRYWLRHWPALRQVLATRHIRYNQTLNRLEQEVKAKHLILIQPSCHQINRYSQQVRDSVAAYLDGYAVTMARLSDIQSFLEEDDDGKEENSKNQRHEND